jgi:hypothetical protein
MGQRPRESALRPAGGGSGWARCACDGKGIEAAQVVLLQAKDGTGAHDADPGHCLRGSKLILQHKVQCDESAQATPARRAVDCYDALVRV